MLIEGYALNTFVFPFELGSLRGAECQFDYRLEALVKHWRRMVGAIFVGGGAVSTGEECKGR